MRSVTELQSRFTQLNGLMRGNRYEVILPTDVYDSPFLSNDTISVLCNSVNLPGKQTLSQDRQIGLAYQKVAYGYAYDDISFLLTNNPLMKEYFESWQQLSVVSDENEPVHFPRYKDEYARQVTINQLDHNGLINYSCVLVEAYPTTVSPVQLGNDQESIIQLDVQISYKRWYEGEKYAATT